MQSDLITWLASNPYAGLAGIACSVIAIPLCIYFRSKDKKEKRPLYHFESQNVFTGLSKQVPKLEITYSGHGEPLATLTFTKFYFWNAGRETIRRADIAKNTPLQIVIDEPFKIIEMEVIHEVNKANDFNATLKQGKSRVSFSFDHCDKDEGIVIQLTHTASSDSALRLNGSIAGAGQPKRGDIMTETTVRRTPIKTLLFVFMLTVYLGVRMLVFKIRWKESPGPGALTFFNFVFGGFLGMVLTMCLSFRKRLPKAIRLD
jgi:hypothetical protein